MSWDVLRWELRQTFRSDDNLLCPSPFVDNDSLYVFYGKQHKADSPATLECMLIEEDFSWGDMKIEYENLEDHVFSHGNLPNSIFSSDGEQIQLICAEFLQSDVHKHRLITHNHHLEIHEKVCIMHTRRNFEFIEYDSEEFHTLAGMSYFESSYFYAKGNLWFENLGTNVPITWICRFDLSKGSEFELEIPRELDVIAYARPNLIRVDDKLFLAVSVRLQSGQYGSRLYSVSENTLKRVPQIFSGDSKSLNENSLAYLYPFFWMNEIWCLATRDYRGTKGFELFQLV